MNESARKARHNRVFANSSALRLRLPRLQLRLSNTPRLFSSQQKISLASLGLSLPLGSHFGGSHSSTDSAEGSLFKRYSAMVALLFIIGSVSVPIGTSAEQLYAGEFGDYTLDMTAFESGLLADGEGYLTKLNPQTSEADRSAMTGRYVHTVQAGETLSTVAESYGLKTQTVLWENHMGNANALRTGQQLVIPPVDGVTHKVAKGESLEKIAKTYNVELGAIEKQNGLLASAVGAGDDVFIPGGKPLVTAGGPATVRTTPARTGTSSRVVAVGASTGNLADSGDVPVGGKPFIFPTRGGITQGFRAGHYAFDIADSSKPPIWAAGAGTVIKASSGTWGGGYGNHVIIDHGNGLQSLYAHMDYLDVSEGDSVSSGQVLGRMGNTGRVYGRTGIHLHFEVIKNGVKQVPSNYY